MRLTIDRYETGFAICEDETGGFVQLPADSLPPGSCEGSVLQKDGDDLALCPNEEQAVRERIRSKLNRLLGK